MSIDVLQDKIRRMKNPVVLSLEPSNQQLPPHLLQEQPTAIAAWETFYDRIMETLKEQIPALRLCLTGFLSMGTEGLSLASRLLAKAKNMGYYVILDGLGDAWGATGEALAQSLWGSAPLYPCDAAVISGYCGTDAVTPFLPYCKEGKALFVLAKSPNRSSMDVQDLALIGRVVHTAMADLINRWGSDTRGKSGYQQVGAVVGAPYPYAMTTFRTKYDRVFTLITGLEETGASIKGCAKAFDRVGHGAAVCAGGYIMNAWAKNEGDGRDFEEKAVEAARKLKKNLTGYVTVL